jgi:hypothetical protein
MKSVVLLVPLILLVPLGSVALACDCIAPPALSRDVRREVPFIFEGKAVEVVERTLHTNRNTSGGGSSSSETLGREVVFEVRRVWNGVATKRIAVASVWSDCMFPFEIDRVYVVFAARDAHGRPTTNACTRTVVSDKAAAVLARLGLARLPK